MIPFTSGQVVSDLVKRFIVTPIRFRLGVRTAGLERKSRGGFRTYCLFRHVRISCWAGSSPRVRCRPFVCTVAFSTGSTYALLNSVLFLGEFPFPRVSTTANLLVVQEGIHILLE